MKDPSHLLTISVIGGASPTDEMKGLAYLVGKGLARLGVTLVSGGLAGVMEASCKGAKEEGGTTIGILPGSNPAEANPYVDFKICTGLGFARNPIVVRSGLSVIAIDGSFGTLSEIGYALSEHIPVIGLDTWKLSHGTVVDNGILIAKDPEDAVEQAVSLAKVRRAKLLMDHA